MTQFRSKSKPEIKHLQARIAELEREVEWLRAVLQAINANLHECFAESEMRSLIIKLLKRKP
jgi:hypothetical protein